MLNRNRKPRRLSPSTAGLLSLLFLTSCGFRPVLRQDPGRQDCESAAWRVKVTGAQAASPPPSVLHLLRIKLHGNLDRCAVKPRCSYKVELQESGGDVAFAANAVALRVQRQLIARVTAVDSSRHAAEAGTADAVTSFEQTESDAFSNTQAQEAANARMIETLAWDIARLIMIHEKGAKEQAAGRHG